MQSFRMQCYQRMLLTNMAEDYSVQEYAMACSDATNKAEQLIDYVDTHEKEMTLEEEAELLITAFIALNASYRDYTLSCRVTDKAEQLLPFLPEDKQKTHLLVYLYMETGDEKVQDKIESMMAEWEEGKQQLTQEDKFLMEVYKLMSEQYLD